MPKTVATIIGENRQLDGGGQRRTNQRRHILAEVD